MAVAQVTIGLLVIPLELVLILISIFGFILNVPSAASMLAGFLLDGGHPQWLATTLRRATRWVVVIAILA